ncbi:glycosyl hydrolase family 28-related protein [Cohnella yongneupensis]|uniref:Glycosyl hydrolase family 28-related protein n=1 Tax=Cohnella yongneupensis TaxID=425006 RepID=A0ABW0R6C5_9BACL
MIWQILRNKRSARKYAAIGGGALLAIIVAIVLIGKPTSPASAPPDGGTVYEAEDQFYSGGVASASSYLNNFAAEGDRVVFTVNMPSTGNVDVMLNYANDTGSDKTLNVYVNGVFAIPATLPDTGGTEKWKKKAESLTLRKGLNTISYQYDSGNSGGVNLDSLSIVGGLPLADRGATVSYQELEAEDGKTNAEVLAPSREYLTVQSESSGRQAVKLTNTGHYVEWTAPQTANSIVIRYSMPDAAEGGGDQKTLSLYVNGTKAQELPLTSRYAWTYGTYPYNDDPSTGEGHHFYDESRFLVSDIPAGATVKLQKDAGDDAANYTIDLIDLEQVDDAYAMPDNFVSVTDFGAVANDDGDDTGAIQDAISGAVLKGKAGVWIPEGTFLLSDHLIVGNVHVRGAGMWRTTLQGTNGKGGFFGRDSNVRVTDLTVAGDSVYRYDSGDDPAFVGNFGPGSLIQNVWVEHMKVGIWLNAGTDGLYMVGGRIHDTWADGVNFHAGVKNTTISHFNVRNTGDDAFAMWSAGMADENNTFRYNTAQIPVLANGFALYGGTNNKVLDNIAADTVTASAGITISTRDFGGTLPISGTTEVRRNTLIRTGGLERNWNTTFGALWIYADNHPITEPIIVSDMQILDSTYDAVKLSLDKTITGVAFHNVVINGAGAYGLNFDHVSGTGNFEGVTISGAASGGVNNSGGQYTIVKGEGNSGW